MDRAGAARDGKLRRYSGWPLALLASTALVAVPAAMAPFGFPAAAFANGGDGGAGDPSAPSPGSPGAGGTYTINGPGGAGGNATGGNASGGGGGGAGTTGGAGGTTVKGGAGGTGGVHGSVVTTDPTAAATGSDGGEGGGYQSNFLILTGGGGGGEGGYGIVTDGAGTYNDLGKRHRRKGRRRRQNGEHVWRRRRRRRCRPVRGNGLLDCDGQFQRDHPGWRRGTGRRGRAQRRRRSRQARQGRLRHRGDELDAHTRDGRHRHRRSQWRRHHARRRDPFPGRNGRRQQADPDGLADDHGRHRFRIGFWLYPALSGRWRYLRPVEHGRHEDLREGRGFRHRLDRNLDPHRDRGNDGDLQHGDPERRHPPAGRRQHRRPVERRNHHRPRFHPDQRGGRRVGQIHRFRQCHGFSVDRHASGEPDRGRDGADCQQHVDAREHAAAGRASDLQPRRSIRNGRDLGRHTGYRFHHEDIHRRHRCRQPGRGDLSPHLGHNDRSEHLILDARPRQHSGWLHLCSKHRSAGSDARRHGSRPVLERHHHERHGSDRRRYRNLEAAKLERSGLVGCDRRDSQRQGRDAVGELRRNRRNRHDRRVERCGESQGPALPHLRLRDHRRYPDPGQHQGQYAEDQGRRRRLPGDHFLGPRRRSGHEQARRGDVDPHRHQHLHRRYHDLGRNAAARQRRDDRLHPGQSPRRRHTGLGPVGRFHLLRRHNRLGPCCEEGPQHPHHHLDEICRTARISDLRWNITIKSRKNRRKQHPSGLHQRCRQQWGDTERGPQ